MKAPIEMYIDRTNLRVCHWKIYPYKAPQFVIGRFYVFYLEQEFFMALVIWKKEISHLNVIYQVQKLLRKFYKDTYEFLPPHLFQQFDAPCQWKPLDRFSGSPLHILNDAPLFLCQHSCEEGGKCH